MTENYFPLIIAHRGASNDAYENSIEAFQLAVEQKADMIELDTHLTSDNHFVVNHDPLIRYEQQTYPIAKNSLKQIQNFRLPNDEQIPLLKDVLDEFHSKIRFNIEVKCLIKKEQFDNLLKETGINTKETVVSSFLHDVHIELKDTELEYELAYLYFFPSSLNKSVAQNSFIKAMNPQYRFLTRKTVNTYHSLGKKVYPWTVDDTKAIRKLVDKRVDGIITNNPAKTREIVEKHLAKNA